MIIAVDFDGTIVDDDRPYDDVTAPLEFLPGAREGLEALRRAGHTLILYSGRANRALIEDPELDPLVRAGVRSVDRDAWTKRQKTNLARLGHMLEFVQEHLPNVFAVVDDGRQGKPSADMFIDDRAWRFGSGALAANWGEIARMWGEPVYGDVLGETERV